MPGSRPMAYDTDRSLLDELRRRSPRLGPRLYDRHAGDVFGFIAHLCMAIGPRPKKSIRKPGWPRWPASTPSTSARGELRAWIFGIARRQVALHFRRLGQGRSAGGFGDGEIVDARDDAARFCRST